MRRALINISEITFFLFRRNSFFHQHYFLKRIISFGLIFLFASAVLFSQVSFSKKIESIVKTGLAAYYPFNRNANDSSGNGYHATVVNATLTADRFGADSSAYSFNGTSNTIQCGDILDSVFCAPIAKFTITGWANTRTCGNYTTGGGMIMSKSSGGGGVYQWNITHQEDLVNVIVVSDGIAQNYLWLTSPMSTNQWFQFALVFDGSLPEMQRLKLYVNGQTSNTSVYKHQGTLGTTTQNTTQHVCIGASHEMGDPQALHSFYDGTIDDIRIYAKALTEEEIDSLYHEGGWPLQTNDLLAYYPFSGNANDSSGNGLHGTVHGATLTKDRFNNDSSAMSFNGINNIIDIGDVLDEVFCNPLATFTISAWAKANAVHGPLPIVIKSAGGTGPYQWTVGIDMAGNSGLATGQIYSDTVAHNYIQLKRPVIANQWYHFVLVFDGRLPENDRVKFYVNGKTDSVYVHIKVGTVGTTTVNSQQYITIGGTHEPGKPQTVASPFSGVIDDIRIYSKPLSAAEIDSLYRERDLNHPPIANAGVNQTVAADTSGIAEVTLDGFASFDVDGDALTYVWKRDTITLGTTAQITVSLPVGSHTVTLTVNDGKGGTSSDSVVIKVVKFINGLLAYYPFNGNASDESGNNNNGIVNGATPVTDRFGKSGSAFHFTNGAYIRIPEIFPDSSPAFTFSAWVKKDTKDNGRHVIIYKGVQKGEASLIVTPGVLGFGVNLHVPGTPTSTQNWYAANVTDTLNAGTFYFIAGRYIKGEKIDLWINGIKVSSSSIPNLNLVSDSLSTYSAIGNHTEPGHSVTDWWNGVIDDVRIHSRALSESEIYSLYHEGGWSLQTNDPLAYYPFSGNANDSSGNGLHGTVHGATLTKDRFNNDSSAMSFNGINNIIDIGDVLDEVFCNPTATFTVSAWAKADSISAPLPIITKSAGGTGPYQWTVGINMAGSSGLATGEIYSDTAAHNYIHLQSSVIANQWYHFTLVFDGRLPENDRVKFYVNGRADKVYVHKKVGMVGTTTVNSQQYISIGGTHEPGKLQTVASPFSGVIDDIRIYAKALTQGEIDSLYREGGWPIQPPASVPLSRVGTEIPKSFQLYDNYPNPFNASTNIRFAIPDEEFVTLKVYDMLGRETAVLLSEYLTPGIYNMLYDAGGISSGIYFYRLKAGAAVYTKRMILIK